MYLEQITPCDVRRDFLDMELTVYEDDSHKRILRMEEIPYWEDKFNNDCKYPRIRIEETGNMDERMLMRPFIDSKGKPKQLLYDLLKTPSKIFTHTDGRAFESFIVYIFSNLYHSDNEVTLDELADKFNKTYYGTYNSDNIEFECARIMLDYYGFSNEQLQVLKSTVMRNIIRFDKIMDRVHGMQYYIVRDTYGLYHIFNYGKFNE